MIPAIQEVSFETVKPRHYNNVARILISTLLVLLCVSSFVVSSNFLPSSSYSSWITMTVALSFLGIGLWYEKKTLLNLKPNGHLIIDASGFTIHQEEEMHIPYNDILFIHYFYDRPANGSKNPPPATYKLRIKTKHKVYFVYVKVSTKRNGETLSFVTIMDTIRTSSSYFYNRIQYRK